MPEFLVVIECEGDTWGAFCPDLPGAGAVGRSRAEVERLALDVVSLHIDGLRTACVRVPAPGAIATTLVQVPAA